MPRTTAATSRTRKAQPDDADRPLRADAERNRRLILDAARVAFAEHGLTASFDEIARTAGVGVGTVYRRFPERDDLIDALFADRIQAMVEIANEAAGIEDSWQAVAWFLEQSIAAQAADRGFAEVLADGLRGRQRLENARNRMVPAVGVLLTRAKQDGVLRADVEVLDLAIMGSMLSRVTTRADPLLWRRYLAISLDGLRRRPDSASLGPAVPEELDLAEITHGR